MQRLKHTLKKNSVGAKVQTPFQLFFPLLSILMKIKHF